METKPTMFVDITRVSIPIWPSSSSLKESNEEHGSRKKKSFLLISVSFNILNVERKCRKMLQHFVQLSSTRVNSHQWRWIAISNLLLEEHGQGDDMMRYSNTCALWNSTCEGQWYGSNLWAPMIFILTVKAQRSAMPLGRPADFPRIIVVNFTTESCGSTKRASPVN